MGKFLNANLNLKQFLLRQTILSLYRDYLRTIRQIPEGNSRAEMQNWIRQDFEMYRNQQDEVTIKTMLQHNRNSLNELKSCLKLSGIQQKK